MTDPGSRAASICVIIPVYNVAGHVAACIDSLRAQTLTRFTAIVVDDGSTDGSGDIARSAIADDPRFRVITQTNAGLSGARNTGLDLAADDPVPASYIAFIDSDDRVMPDYLMRLWHTLEETGGDWVACAIQSNSADGTGSCHSAIHGAPDLSQHTTARRYDFTDWSDVIRHFPSAWNKLYRRSLIEGLRFDEGTWFEDHGFFHRAAARTDHIIHLPEVLYLQTRGREGQITTTDDERVFEQFDVLADMHRMFTRSTRPGGDLALARIASRLVFERSTIIADPVRRARFATAARDFLHNHGLDYSTDWDSDIGLSWGLEMAGALPLSVILSWDGKNPEALNRSLEGLRAQTAPAHEVLIICRNTAAQRALHATHPDTPPHWRSLVAPDAGPDAGPDAAIGAGFNHGLAQARGAYVIFLLCGDAHTPWSLLAATEAMLRADADFGISQMRLHDSGTGVVSYHNGIHDMSCWAVPHAPPAGVLEMTPLQMLSLEAQCSAKIFSRAFLAQVFPAAAAFTPGPHSDWALCLIAALRARTVTYIAQAAVTVPMQDQGFTRWRSPTSARTMQQGHTALLEAVSRHTPEAQSTTLPRGWQRRLFARALREQVYFGQYSGRRTRLVMIAGASALSARLGYGAPQDAGLDPAVGPRLSRMMHPAAVLMRHKTVHDATVQPVSGQRSAEDILLPPAQHAFDLHRHGILAFQAQFTADAPYANIFFHTAGRRRVVFHLSLRHADGVAVCNDQHRDGRWRTERSCPVDLSSGQADVIVTFTPPHVEVHVNGRATFRFGGRSWQDRSGFSDLQTIAGFTLEGHVTPHHVIPDVPTDAPTLDSRLMLRTAPGAQGPLHVTPDQSDLPLIVAPAGRAAMLPARLWRDVPAQGALSVTHDGTTLTLTRADMAARIETLLCLPLAPTDSTLALHLLEHVRHGDLAGLLSAPARAHLGRIAKFYRLVPFVDLPATPLPPLYPDPVNLQVDAVVARLSQSQRTHGAHPDPLSVVAGMQVFPAAQQPLFLALTEYFCVRARDFDGLYRLAQQNGLLPLSLPADRWSLSAALPYLALGGQYVRMSEALHQLVPPTDDWPVMPAIGWAVRHVLTQSQAPADIQTAIFDSFAALLRARAPDYWDRAQCRELTRTAAALIRQTPDALSGDAVTALCLEVYGLSQQFWDDLEGTPELPEPIERARAAYGVVMSHHAAARDRADALHLFEAAHTFEVPRFRREIFGPAGLDAGRLGRIPPAGNTQLSRDILRHIAGPDSAPLPDGLARLAAEALPALYSETPRAPDFDHQQATTTRAMAWLADPAADLTALTDSLIPLTKADAHHLGLGMALALIDAAQDVAAEQALALCDWLRAHLPQDTAWRTAPAVRQPVRRLRARNTLLPCVQALLDDLELHAEPSGTDSFGPEGSPLFDTLVTVFSCAPYLETRIPALRAGWLALLADLDVPYVVMVGNGDGTRRGDTVHLDAPDDYEGLPQKTLAAIEWVHTNTRFGHMLKIDDDCFLNAPLFFTSLSYAKFDYYGRRLMRTPGQTDRIWHQGKSTSPRGRMDLDKSPEPSEYADGGSAYSLSRTAMAAALDAAASPEGQQLISVSFMEDKMLGDLLAMRGIRLADEDYRVSIRRRNHADAIPVAAWLNSFHASPTAPLQLVHLDTHHDQAAAVAQLATPGLWPRKIWPSYQDVKLGYNTNALELVSDQTRIAQARAAEVAVIACMRNEMFMLPHFLAHYRKLGVEAFIIADNASDDGSLEYLTQQPDVTLFSVDTDYSASHYGVAWQQAMMANLRVDKWSLMADADELLVWQEHQTQTLPDLLRDAEFADADAVRLFMLDMYPKGPLEDADFTTGTPFDQAGFADRIPFLTNTLARGPHSDQPCWTSALRHRLIPGSRINLFVAQKLALLRYSPAMHLSAGLHFVGGAKIAQRELIFAHFKYNADFRRKAQAEVLRGQHFNNAEEYRAYLALVAEGRSVIYDPALSVPWTQVPFVKNRL